MKRPTIQSFEQPRIAELATLFFIDAIHEGKSNMSLLMHLNNIKFGQIHGIASINLKLVMTKIMKLYDQNTKQFIPFTPSVL